MLSKLKADFFNRFDVKLTISYTLALLLLSTVLSAFLYYRLEHNLFKQIDRVLSDTASELFLEFEEEMHEEKDGAIQPEQQIVRGCKSFSRDISNRKYYRVFFRIMTLEGMPVWESERFRTIFTQGLTGKENVTIIADTGAKARYRVYEKKFPLAGNGEFVAQLMTDTERTEEILGHTVENILYAAPLTFLLSILCGIYISQRPRKIIQNITAVTNKITSRNLAERLPLPPVRDEIRDLTVTINSMLDRIESSFEEVRQFTADVSHELRNPLSAIKGEIEVAVSHKRDPAEYLETLYNCLERTSDMIKMVNDLFLISRFDAKKYAPEFNRTLLSDLLRELYDFFLPMAQGQNIQFTMDRCDDVSAFVERRSILQLLSNLIDNAIKFTPGNGTINLSLTGRHDKVELTVSDSGIGIPENELENIFKRFYQVDRSRSGDERGAGLGLHICKRIAEVHGGSIIAGINPTGGATFTVRLPLSTGDGTKELE